MDEANTRPTIMIIDDAPANLKVLDGMLQQQGYRIMAFPRGALALKAAAKHPPDLVLLDITMPDMNGFEVCEQLKANANTKDTPVLFISGRSDTANKVRAFSAGAVDYVTKPFQVEEVRARVETHLELRRQRRKLQQAYDQLRDLESLRDSLVHMVVHDMRSPLTGILGYLGLLKDRVRDRLTEQEVADLEHASHLTSILVEMANTLLDVNRLESGQMPLDLAAYDLRIVTQEGVELLGHPERIDVCIAPTPHPVVVQCDRDVIRRVAANLVSNAIKFTLAPGSVQVAVDASDGWARVTVKDTGPGIPPKDQKRIFDKFSQAEAGLCQRRSSGLGLTFCRLAVLAHGGRIGLDSEEGKGSTFWFELPLAPVP